MQANFWYHLLDYLRTQWRKYKSTICWLIVCLIAGIVFGVITIIVTDVAVGDINYHLIDGNILNATSTGSSMGNFIWQRVLSIAVPVIVVMIFASISRFTALAVFPVVFIHGYWLAIAIWWTFFYYSFTALLLIIFYVFWLLLVTAVLLGGLLWALQCGENMRISGKHCESKRDWGFLIKGSVILIGIAVLLGFFEYLVFWTILGKIVYKPR
ncbi:MAG: hypothetical protein MJ054_00095 [Clostridia bacterium]|nr:hypothetical protein [Clostridia bacterium]